MTDIKNSVTLFESFSFKGLELRDFFAASWIANRHAAHDNPHEQARRAYEIADAMIEIRMENTNG
jgi:hypothetical protein